MYESAVGYAIFKLLEFEGIALDNEGVQESIGDYERFSKVVKLKSFLPFETATAALENTLDVSEGILHKSLKDFIGLALAKVKKSSQLGVNDPNLGSSIKAELKIECIHNDVIKEIYRGIKLHFDKLLGGLKYGDLEKAQLGLGHAYSRAKVKCNVNRTDNMIIQSISLLDNLDKDINKFYMRAREWYSWTFPELAKIVTDNVVYLKIAASLCDNPSLISSNDTSWLISHGLDQDSAIQVVSAAKMSMGAAISEADTHSIKFFLNMVIGLISYRQKLYDYLLKKMKVVAPNLSALIGEVVGARLISHSGSLTNLSKYPASTVQIIGAEKALFRALNTKGKTPKYGIIYNSSFISSAAQRDKGRISRMLANKCSLASRIDCFYDIPTPLFGEKLREQLEERLEFYKSGKVPKKNIKAMEEAVSKTKKLRLSTPDDN